MVVACLCHAKGASLWLPYAPAAALACCVDVQELPKSESAAWAALPGLQQLAAAAGAYQLVACAEAAVEGAAGAEGATKGLEGLGLAAAAAQQQVRSVHWQLARAGANDALSKAAAVTLSRKRS